MRSCHQCVHAAAPGVWTPPHRVLVGHGTQRRQQLQQQLHRPAETPLTAAASRATPPAGRRQRRVATLAAAFDACTLLAVASNLDAGAYELGQAMNGLVQDQLADLSPATCGAVLLAGLVTSVSPCTLSVLPLTIGYIAGYAGGDEDGEQQQQQQQQRQQGGGDRAGSKSATSSSTTTSSGGGGGGEQQAEGAAAALAPSAAGTQQAGAAASDCCSSSPGSRSSRVPTTTSSSSTSGGGLGVAALCFSLGLASSLAGLGVASASLGRVYGTTGLGPALPAAVALVAIAMGLNLLQVVRLPLPSFLQDVDLRDAAGLPRPLAAYLAGGLFALAASPCSTPVLASLLAFASTQQHPGTGGALLFLYSCGYVAPLLAAATATGAAKRLLALRAYSAWVTPASGVLLVSGGTYALLSRLLPAL